MIPKDKINRLKEEFKELSLSIYSPAKMANQREYKLLSRNFND